jgi:V/A-type H+-transporting ATPase subunit F
MKYDKMAVIGKAENITGFKAAGVEVFAVSESGEAKKVLFNIARKGYAVILLTEDLAADMAETLHKYKNQAYPAIIPIPTAKGSDGTGLKGIIEDADKAIGAELLFREQ